MKLFINRNKNLIAIIEYDDGTWLQTTPICKIVARDSTTYIITDDGNEYMVGYGDDILIPVNPFDYEYWLGKPKE